jgi:hypothetical protein
MLMTAVLLMATACSDWDVNRSDGEVCEVERGWSEEQLLSACGTPSGLRYQPEVIEGLFRPKLCSAPAYVYHASIVAFGCAHTVSFVRTDDWEGDGFVKIGVNDLIQELKGGTNQAAAAAELANTTLNSDDRPRAIVELEKLTMNKHDAVRRAAVEAVRQIQSR